MRLTSGIFLILQLQLLHQLVPRVQVLVQHLLRVQRAVRVQPVQAQVHQRQQQYSILSI